MRTLLSFIAALALIFSGVAFAAPGVGVGPGVIQAQSCGAGAVGVGQMCTGTGVPALNCTVGSFFIRTDGGVGTTLYYCSSANTWTADASGVPVAGTNIGVSGSTVSLASPLTTSLIVGPGAPTCTTVGEICSAISASSGEILFGGSTVQGISFGVHHVASTWLNTAADNVDIGDGSTALIRFNCATSACSINTSNDAVNANEPLNFNGFGGAAGSTATFNFATLASTGIISAGSATQSGSLTAGDVGASRSSTTGEMRMGGSSSSATLDYAITHAGEITSSVKLGWAGDSSACGSSLLVPCTFTWTCAMTSGACTTTASVPTGAICTITPGVTAVLSSTNLASAYVTISSNTLTIHVNDMLGTSAATFSGNGHCL